MFVTLVSVFLSKLHCAQKWPNWLFFGGKKLSIHRYQTPRHFSLLNFEFDIFSILKFEFDIFSFFWILHQKCWIVIFFLIRHFFLDHKKRKKCRFDIFAIRHFFLLPVLAVIVILLFKLSRMFYGKQENIQYNTIALLHCILFL